MAVGAVRTNGFMSIFVPLLQTPNIYRRIAKFLFRLGFAGTRIGSYDCLPRKGSMEMKRALLDQLVGVKPPFTQAALFEEVAGLIFMATLFWPHMSITNMIKGLLIGAIWAVYGFVSYLRAVSESAKR